MCVIGGGIFGVTAALELSRFSDVTLYEKADALLQGPSTNNHLRHHYGYHYPRSKKTAQESIDARSSFESEYGDCISVPFPAYYAVSKQNSKTTPAEFIAFCKSLDLPLKQVDIDPKLVNKDKVAALFLVPEPVYNPKKLRDLLEAKLQKTGIAIKFNHEVVGGEIQGNKKILRVRSNGKVTEDEFDAVVSAIYVNFNDINKWFNLPRKKFLYELIELLELEMPGGEKFGLTLIDGEFSSVLPREGNGTFTLGHVRESVLKELVSDDAQKDLMSFDKVPSNKEAILSEGIRDFPILQKARFVRSIFVGRIVKAGVDDTDERPTEITEHGNGIYSIFGGKVITCVDAAKKLGKLLSERPA